MVLVLVGTQLQRSLRNLMFRFLVSLTKEGWNGIQRQSTVYTAVLNNEIGVLRRDLHFCVHCSVTVVKIWKQPNYLSADKRVKKMPHTHTQEHYSALK